MSEAAGNLMLLLGLGAVGYGLYQYLQQAGGSAGGDGGDTTMLASSDGGQTIDPNTIAQMAQEMLGQMGITDISPAMVTAIAMIESGGDPGAVRQEPAINDASYGLMQTLLGTATWLADSMGYDGYGAPSAQLLTQPQASLYFGIAYLHWLRNYNGQVQQDSFVVPAYNGGPGNPTGPGPQAYYARYQQMLAGLQLGEYT